MWARFEHGEMLGFGLFSSTLDEGKLRGKAH